MTNVYCADSSCKFVNDDGVCTQKRIALGWRSVMTVYDGRQKYNLCKMYEESDRAATMRKFIEQCEKIR